MSHTQRKDSSKKRSGNKSGNKSEHETRDRRDQRDHKRESKREHVELPSDDEDVIDLCDDHDYQVLSAVFETDSGKNVAEILSRLQKDVHLLATSVHQLIQLSLASQNVNRNQEDSDRGDSDSDESSGESEEGEEDGEGKKEEEVKE